MGSKRLHMVFNAAKHGSKSGPTVAFRRHPSMKPPPLHHQRSIKGPSKTLMVARNVDPHPPGRFPWPAASLSRGPKVKVKG